MCPCHTGVDTDTCQTSDTSSISSVGAAWLHSTKEYKPSI